MNTRSRVPNGGVQKPKEETNPTLFQYRYSVNSTDKSNLKSDKSVITYTRHDHKTLQPPKFLNDTIISFFMQFHLDNHVGDEIKQSIHVFNSFFFAKIKSVRKQKHTEDLSFAHASRWLKSVDIFEKDFLVMPVCENDHWILVVVCYPGNAPKHRSHQIPDEELREPAVFVLNSCKVAPAIKKALAQFLRFQWYQERTTQRTFNINQAKKSGIKLVFPELPQQRNHYDCGVYILGYFYCFLKDPRAAYIKMFRKQSMKNWFLDNGIDISRERRKMSTVINNQIATWQRLGDLNNQTDSQEIHIDSPQSNSSVDLMVDEEKGNGSKTSVIVIH